MKKIVFAVLACLSLGTVMLSPVRAADKVEWKKGRLGDGRLTTFRW